MNLNNWHKSEHSFLTSFCDSQVYHWGIRYYWDQGKQWPKFNFIRLFGNTIDLEDLSSIKQIHQALKAPLNIKLNIQYKVPKVLDEKLSFGGIPIAYTSTAPADFKTDDRNINLQKVETIEKLSLWWEINSDGRTRDNFNKSPLFKRIENNFLRHQFYLAFREEVAVGSVATTHFEDGINIWGLAVRREYQKQGIMRSIFSKLSELHSHQAFFCQTNLNSETFNFLLKKTSTEVMAIEKKYELFI